MSNLLEFLNEMFGPNSGATVEDIKRRFNADFGVMVDVEDDLYLFKYDLIMVKWNPVTHECRGTIMARLPDGTWKYVSRPPNKFFNLREGHCIYSDNKKLMRDLDTLELVQKADGSAIQMYYWNRWRISTLGKITPLKVGDYAFTFADLFMKLFGEDNLIHADKSVCYFHELCTRYNQIVTQYEEDTIFLLTARNVETGEYIATSELDTLACEKFHEKRPYRIKVSEITPAIESLDALESYVETLALDPRFGKNSEGFVLSNPVPLGKCKNRRYLVLHRLIGGGDKGHTVNNLLDLFFTGAIDDVYSDLSDVQVRAIESLKGRIAGYNTRIEDFMGSIGDVDRKTFALKVNELSDLKMFSAYLFNRYLNREDGSLSEWLVAGKGHSRNWSKFDNVWKSEFTI